jgi:AraC-like DNA-binding protein
LCRKLKTHEATSHIPVILLTARAGLDDRLEGLETGADDYLTKPFDMRELRSRIQNLVRQRSLLHEKYSKEGLFQYRHVKVSSLDNDFMLRLYATLEENFQDSTLSVEELSRKMGVSRVQLHRKLTALSGYAPGELLREFRLQRAADLLRQRAGNVSEIAFRVGFENLSYFTKVFKQKFQATPSEYFQQ